MNILSLDLSTKSSGYAIGNQEKLIKSGIITSKAASVEKRIIQMQTAFKTLIQQENIDFIIIEEVRPELNSHTNKVLMWLQGAIILVAYQINSKIKYQFISSSQWRSILKIKQGKGFKRQIVKQEDIQYVKQKYNKLTNDDEADAICIFDAFIQKNNNQINWG